MARPRKSRMEYHAAQRRASARVAQMERAAVSQPLKHAQATRAQAARIERAAETLKNPTAQKVAKQAAKAEIAANTEQPIHKPRKKTKADEIYNARRRAKRRAERLERDAKNMSAAERQGALMEAAKLRELAAQTYDRGGATQESRKKAASALNAATQKKKKGVTPAKQERKNLMFLKAVMKKPSMKKKIHIFYSATRRLWEGAPSKDRLKLIMLGLGTGSLKEAFNMVMDKNAKAVRLSESSDTIGAGYTDENEAFYQGEADLEGGGSARYMDYVVMY